MQVYGDEPVARVTGIGAFLPETEVDNDAIAARVEAPSFLRARLASLITRATGSKTRREAPSGTYPSDLALPACLQALEEAGIEASEVDTLIFASTDLDVMEPATANILQKKLGISVVNAFDVSNACNSFLQGLNVANSLIATGAARRVLVASGEAGTHFASRRVESIADLNVKLGGLTLGDAGAAMVVEAAALAVIDDCDHPEGEEHNGKNEKGGVVPPSQQRQLQEQKAGRRGNKKQSRSGFVEINLMSLGEHWELCRVPPNARTWRLRGDSRKGENVDVGGSIHGWFYLDMSALAVVAREWSVRYFREYGAYRCAAHGEKSAGDPFESLSWVVPHQISRRFIERISRDVFDDYPRCMERIVVTADRYGNTASTAIPVALRELMDRGDVELGSGQEVFLYGAASGFSLGHIRIRM